MVRCLDRSRIANLGRSKSTKPESRVWDHVDSCWTVVVEGSERSPPSLPTPNNIKLRVTIINVTTKARTTALQFPPEGVTLTSGSDSEASKGGSRSVTHTSNIGTSTRNPVRSTLFPEFYARRSWNPNHGPSAERQGWNGIPLTHPGPSGTTLSRFGPRMRAASGRKTGSPQVTPPLSKR